MTLPKTWLRRIGLDDDTDQAELVLSEQGITLEPSTAGESVIEQDVAFSSFLAFLAHAAVDHPEHLSNAADILADDQDLVPMSEITRRGA